MGSDPNLFPPAAHFLRHVETNPTEESMDLRHAIRAALAAGVFAAAPVMADTFDTLDKNNDGKLDPTEAAAVPGLQ